jgi:glycosyltransferase involved in cell wall biosynthesis
MDCMKIGIIAERFLADTAGTIAIGGVQVWLSELVKVIKKLGHQALVVQKYKDNIEVDLEWCKVKGIKYGTASGFGNEFILDWKYNVQAHRIFAKEGVERIVYANSLVTFPIYRPGNVFLQHGIYWDGDFGFSYRRLLGTVARRLIQPFTTLTDYDLKLYQKSCLTIAVDTNFINYARAMLRGKYVPEKMVYIPNFSQLPEETDWKRKWENTQELVFLFPRRFTAYRGALLWADAVDVLLGETKKTRFVFDGEGQYGMMLKKRFHGNPRVQIRSVNPKDMPAEYKMAHVVVVPTIFSEGTSLSCIEGMAYGCVPIVTDVGGLANLVFPDYNGFIVRPIVEELIAASYAIINNIDYAREMAEKSQAIVRTSLSLSVWHQRIEKALRKILF